jgi:uncharacterized protein (DUF433 family)
MTIPNFLTQDARGDIRLTGHRIGLFHVVDHYRRGLSAAEIEQQYDTLALPLIEQVLAFYRANQAEVDRYCDEYREELRRLEATTRHSPSLEELKRRLAEQRAAVRGG